ncbi:MAG TPA: hypothetical protein VFB84_20610 [Micromonosporaceae bacterium]|nr:hypothetical protein [Micromonosporaceae bacterium]
MTVREEAHRLIDAVPEDRLPAALEVLRQWAESNRQQRPVRRFRTTAIFDGEPDLGVRSKDIVRQAWDSEECRPA